MNVPNYQELSVKNLYDDAMADPLLSMYLPTREQLSGKLPERDFFFGVLTTLKNQYMIDIIKDANGKRFKASEDPNKKEGILITEDWFKELTAHPFHSSKCLLLTSVEKPGTGIFLMRERAKLYKSQSNRKSFTLSKRLNQEEEKDDDLAGNNSQSLKRKKGNDGKQQAVKASP